MKIRFIGIFTLLVLCLSLCACGNKDTSVSSGSENNISSEQESSTVSEIEESSNVSEAVKSFVNNSKADSKVSL